MKMTFRDQNAGIGDDQAAGFEDHLAAEIAQPGFLTMLP
jgi:hypothetical protein